jgi:hypothetical protein
MGQPVPGTQRVPRGDAIKTESTLTAAQLPETSQHAPAPTGGGTT